MENTLFILIILIMIGMAAFAFSLFAKLKKLEESDNVGLIKSDLVELNRSLRSMQEKVSDRLEQNNYKMQESMQKQLMQSAKIIADVSNRLTKLDETNARVVDVASDLKTLQNVLQSPKQRGVFGEFYLQSVLENVLPPKQFRMQYKFKNGLVADAVIFLERNMILPIDSKFSLENYNRMVTADSKEERARLLAKVRQDLKGRIDETSKYILPSDNTMDFAFMFIPSESLYYDLLIGDVGTGMSARDLVEYAFQEKKVIIVSPTSFMAYLQTVL